MVSTSAVWAGVVAHGLREDTVLVQDERAEADRLDDGTLSTKRGSGRDRSIELENLDLRRLTTAERLWIWRRRHESLSGRGAGPPRRGGGYGRGGARMSANEAAALLGVSPATYCAAESGENPDHVWELAVSASTKTWKLSANLTTPEACVLARRRSGDRVADICARLGGISKPTFFKREAAGDQSIVDMWRARGFTF